MPRRLALKYISLACVAAIGLVLAGCGGSDENNGPVGTHASVRVFNATGGTLIASSGNTTLTGTNGISNGQFFPNNTGGFTRIGAGTFAVTGTGPGGSIGFNGNLSNGGFFTLVGAGAGTAAQPFQFFLVPAFNTLPVIQGGQGPITSGMVAVRVVNLTTGTNPAVAVFSAGPGGVLGNPFNTQFGTGFDFGFSPLITPANQFMMVNPADLTNLQIVSMATNPPTVLTTVPAFPGTAGQAWTLFIIGNAQNPSSVQAIWVRDIVAQWTP